MRERKRPKHGVDPAAMLADVNKLQMIPEDAKKTL
jgi:hypothetical protein